MTKKVRILQCICKANLIGSTKATVMSRNYKFKKLPAQEFRSCRCELQTTYTKTGKGVGRKATFSTRLLRVARPTKKISQMTALMRYPS